VTSLTNVTQIAAGGYQTCALLTDGTVRCWGANHRGQLGDGTTTNRAAPATVVGLSNVAEIAVGRAHGCARLRDGTVRCWGNNEYGALGDGARTSRSAPAAVVGLSDAVEIAAGGDQTCARISDGTVRCWGTWDFTFPVTTAVAVTPVAVTDLSNVMELALGAGHACARIGDGSVRCRGTNDARQLGDGTTTARAGSAAVAGLSGIVEIAAGTDGSHTCARRADGVVRCWGRNASGQLGDGAAPYRSVPVTVIGLRVVSRSS
jgi:alpha-tubulin suppressor-like RCC1 family protein